MSQYWSSVVHALTPYVPGEQPKLSNLIKLNTNENPYGPAPGVIAALINGAADTLRLYPDPNAADLKRAIAHYYDVELDCVFVGNGSDEVLAHTFHALLNHQQPLLFPDVTYSFYSVYCQLYRIPFELVPLSDTFEIGPQDYLKPNGGIIFPNPNAPTGIVLSLAAIEELVKANSQSVVVIDEAYIDFGGESAVPLVKLYPNLLVIQTLSKSRSLAGLRVGFAIAHHDLIEALERVKNSFNSYPLGRLAIAGAVAAIEDKIYFEKTRRSIIKTRENLKRDLINLDFDVLPSQANFLFVKHRHFSAETLARSLRDRAIIVRHFRQPRIEQYLRITIGTDLECAALVQALRDMLNKNG